MSRVSTVKQLHMWAWAGRGCWGAQQSLGPLGQLTEQIRMLQRDAVDGSWWRELTKAMPPLLFLATSLSLCFTLSFFSFLFLFTSIYFLFFLPWFPWALSLLLFHPPFLHPFPLMISLWWVLSGLPVYMVGIAQEKFPWMMLAGFHVKERPGNNILVENRNRHSIEKQNMFVLVRGLPLIETDWVFVLDRHVCCLGCINLDGFTPLSFLRYL